MNHTKTSINSKRTPSRGKGRYPRAYDPSRFTQEGELLNVTATVPKRIHTLIRTEAAINNQTVSACLLAILEQRYRLVD